MIGTFEEPSQVAGVVVVLLVIWVMATQIFFIFTPKVGEMIQFENGLKPPTSYHSYHYHQNY